VVIHHAITGHAPQYWLTGNLPVYLNGFWNRRIRPKTAKDSQKVAGEKYEIRAFTMPALTIIARYAAARFGMVSDRFGIPWIINCEKDVR
jgi:hypothetical protein